MNLSFLLNTFDAKVYDLYTTAAICIMFRQDVQNFLNVLAKIKFGYSWPVILFAKIYLTYLQYILKIITFGRSKHYISVCRELAWKRLWICRKTRLRIKLMTDFFQKVLNCIWTGYRIQLIALWITSRLRRGQWNMKGTTDVQFSMDISACVTLWNMLQLLRL